MLNSRARAHNLHITLPDHLHVAHVVLVLQVAGSRKRDDLHVVMRVSAKAHSARDRIIIQNSQSTEMNSLRVIITRKTERVITIQPTMVSMSSCVCFV